MPMKTLQGYAGHVITGVMRATAGTKARATVQRHLTRASRELAEADLPVSIVLNEDDRIGISRLGESRIQIVATLRVSEYGYPIAFTAGDWVRTCNDATAIEEALCLLFQRPEVARAMLSLFPNADAWADPV